MKCLRVCIAILQPKRSPCCDHTPFYFLLYFLFYFVVRHLNGCCGGSQEQAMDLDPVPTKRTLSHWSVEEKDSFLDCFTVRSASPPFPNLCQIKM